MPADRHDLAARIAALCADLRDIPPVQMDAICNLARDRLSDDGLGDIHTDAQDESLIDGLRWGHRAAWICERHGGAIVRIRTPHGQATSHEVALVPRNLDVPLVMRAAKLEILAAMQPREAAS